METYTWPWLEDISERLRPWAMTGAFKPSSFLQTRSWSSSLPLVKNFVRSSSCKSPQNRGLHRVHLLSMPHFTSFSFSHPLLFLPHSLKLFAFGSPFSFLSSWNPFAVRDLPFTPSLPLTVTWWTSPGARRAFW